MATETPSKPPFWKRPLFLLVLVFLIVVTAYTFWPSVKSPWAPTTMPYGDCGDDCIDLGSHVFAHAGDVQFYYDPDVDDPVAQWAGCLDSVLKCVSDGVSSNKNLLGDCVTASSCPALCKDTFAQNMQSANTPQAQLDQFEKVFLAEGATCKPRE